MGHLPLPPKAYVAAAGGSGCHGAAQHRAESTRHSMCSASPGTKLPRYRRNRLARLLRAGSLAGRPSSHTHATWHRSLQYPPEKRFPRVRRIVAAAAAQAQRLPQLVHPPRTCGPHGMFLTTYRGRQTKTKPERRSPLQWAVHPQSPETSLMIKNVLITGGAGPQQCDPVYMHDVALVCRLATEQRKLDKQLIPAWKHYQPADRQRRLRARGAWPTGGNYVLDTRRFSDVTGWRSRTSVRCGIRRLHNWLRRCRRVGASPRAAQVATLS